MIDLAQEIAKAMKLQASDRDNAIRALRPYALMLRYRNYRGEERIRTVLPLRVYHGSNIWHTEPQWLMDAIDVDGCVEKSFAMKDIR